MQLRRESRVYQTCARANECEDSVVTEFMLLKAASARFQ
jgi:hypothetical protein